MGKRVKTIMKRILGTEAKPLKPQEKLQREAENDLLTKQAKQRRKVRSNKAQSSHKNHKKGTMLSSLLT